MTKTFPFIAAATFAASVSIVHAQVPKDIADRLKKIGPIVDPACTAILYRPLMPKNDYNTYWPPGAAAPAFTGPLYPGVTIARDQSFGPNPKDLLDVFSPDGNSGGGGGNRTVLIYVAGGAGNKIEQQVREANAFYDNIGRWAVKNGMIGVTIQRHPGTNWDDGGRDISLAVDWVKANIAKYKGNPERLFIWAHSAGNGPLGQYVAHPERWKNGVPVKGAIFMSGNPVPGLGAAPGGGRGAGTTGAATPPPQPGAACGLPPTSMTASQGAIAGPSGVTPAPARGAGPGGVGPGVPGAGGGRGQLTPQEQAERDNLPGFKTTAVRLMLARAEFDPGVSGDMIAADKALHDELCKTEGAAAKDGVGRCPTMFFVKGHSHISEVFSIDTKDTTVSGPILDWIRKTK